MWSLLLGTADTTDDEEENDASQVLQPPKGPQSNITPCSSLQLLDSTRIPSTCDRPAAVEGLRNVVKHRMPSPTREQGDGMECSSDNKLCSSKTETQMGFEQKGKQTVIILPQTNVRLDKLPPITADKDVSLPASKPTSPLVQMTVSTGRQCGAVRHQSTEVSPAHLKKTAKEPRFVPYEPYKAAVSSFVPIRNLKPFDHVPSGCAPSSASSGLQAKEKERLKPTNDRKLGGRKDVDEDACEDKMLRGLLHKSNAKLEEAENRLAEARKQLKIQMQVNAEVKKLLVASVGEDIEAKVDCLTQDKARLVADIRNYSHTISRDFEEKEKLSVESDLWKSKFLACSVIVDELARWKASLLQKFDGVDHYVRLLLHERMVLWSFLTENLDVVDHLQLAFDPLSTVKKPGDDVAAATSVTCSVLGLAERSLKVSNNLRERLLGADKRNEENIKADSTPQMEMMDTPAEEGLREIISYKLESPVGDEDCSAQASAAITGAAQPYLAKIRDKLDSPNVNSSQFKCCSHCHGSVQVV